MTDRIRWEDKTPGNGDVYNVASIGYAGTITESAFIIYTPDELRATWLLSVRLTPGSQFLYGSGIAEMKAEAERLLSEFVSSLGAVFPEGDGYEFGDDDEDGEPLEVKYAPGRRVRFAHPGNGYPGDGEQASRVLRVGEVYVIEWSDIGFSSTRLGLAGIESGLGFNSVLFEPVDDQETAAMAGKD